MYSVCMLLYTAVIAIHSNKRDRVSYLIDTCSIASVTKTANGKVHQMHFPRTLEDLEFYLQMKTTWKKHLDKPYQVIKVTVTLSLLRSHPSMPCSPAAWQTAGLSSVMFSMIPVQR